MGTKKNPGKFDCYKRAKADEELFILLGRDPFGASLVRLWAATRRDVNPDDPKAAEAEAIASRMYLYCVETAGREPLEVIQHLPLELLAEEFARRARSDARRRVAPRAAEPPEETEEQKMLAAGFDRYGKLGA